MYPLAVGVIIQTKELWDELQTCTQDMPLRVVLEQAQLGDWSALLEKLGRLGPDVILLDASCVRDGVDEAVKRISGAPSNPSVLLLNTTADANTVLAAFRAGAVEFLLPPFKDALRTALEKLAPERERRGSMAQRRGGRTIGFLSAKGGCGATTLACHTAIEMGQVTNGKVLLADLDLDSGLIDFLMKTKSAYTLADALGNVHRLDASFWHGLISNGIPNMEILTAPVTLAGKAIRPERLPQVLAFARTQYDWLIADLGRGVSPSVLRSMEALETTYLVTTFEVPALHSAKQAIQTITEGGYPRSSLKLIVNRTPKRSDITLQELEQMLGLPIDSAIPNDYQTVQEAYSEGKLIPSASILGRQFHQLARKIGGVPEPQAKKRFSLFG